MDFLTLSLVYFGFFSLIACCLLARPNLSIFGYLGQLFSRVYSRLVPVVIQLFFEDACEFIFKTRNHVFTSLYVILTTLVYFEWAFDAAAYLFKYNPNSNHVILPIFAAFFNFCSLAAFCFSDPGVIPTAFTAGGTHQFVTGSRERQRSSQSNSQSDNGSSGKSKSKSKKPAEEPTLTAEEKEIRRFLGIDVHPRLEFPYDGAINVPEVYCNDCARERPARSVHCQLCKACVSRFDHHCAFANNCIGLRNHRLFLLFLICLIINACVLLHSFISSISELVEANKLWDVKLVRRSAASLPNSVSTADGKYVPDLLDMTFPLLVETLFREYPRMIASCFMLLFLVIWLVAYVLWHAYLISINRTQRERRKLSYFGVEEKRKFVATYNHGFIANWKEVLLGRSTSSVECDSHLHND